MEARRLKSTRACAHRRAGADASMCSLLMCCTAARSVLRLFTSGCALTDLALVFDHGKVATMMLRILDVMPQQRRCMCALCRFERSEGTEGHRDAQLRVYVRTRSRCSACADVAVLRRGLKAV